MTDLVVVPQQSQWYKLKTLVLDSVSSPITKRVYNLGLDEFFAWYGQELRAGFTKATVAAWRVALEARGLGAVSINVRITAVRKLAVEAADNGLVGSLLFATALLTEVTPRRILIVGALPGGSLTFRISGPRENYKDYWLTADLP